MKTVEKNFAIGFIILFFCMLITMLPAKNAYAKSAEGTYRYDLAWELFDCLNQTRVSLGLPKLKQDQYLTDIAMMRAGETSIVWDHYRPDGSYFTSAGDYRLQMENISYGWKTAQIANSEFVNSPPHYKSMTTTSCNAVGVGCFEAADGTLYWVENFGTFTSTAVKQSNISTISKINISSIENLAGGIRIKWNKISGATGYVIYRKAGNGSWEKIKSIKNNSTTKYKDTSVKDNTGKKYSYKVIPRMSNGKTGSGKQSSIYRITKPTGLKLSSSGGTITAKWNRIPKASGYEIGYSETSSFTSTWISETSNSKNPKLTFGTYAKFNTSHLTAGETYYVRIRAYIKKNGKTYYSAYSKTGHVTAQK